MKTLVQLSCDQLKSNFSLRCYSYILEARRWVEHITKLQGFKQHIDDEVGINAQWESARPNLDLPKIEARSEVSA